MPYYVVTKREVWTQDVVVKADSSQQAVQRVARGLGEDIDNTLEYSHDLDENLWTVEETPTPDIPKELKGG